MKRGYIISLIILLFITLSLSNSSGFLTVFAVFGSCSDNTINNQCSLEQPFYCSNGELIKNCNLCGCAQGYNCNTISNECELASYCGESNGVCQAICENNLIELVPLTESCNGGENLNKQIDLAGSSLILEVKLENTNEAPITGISALAYIPSLSPGDGFFLQTLEGLATFEKGLIINFPSNLDKNKSYELIFNLIYQDKVLEERYAINFETPEQFVFTLNNVEFLTDGTEIRLVEDLKYDIKVVNRKCCVTSKIQTNTNSFIGYCNGKVTYNECSNEKPLFCDNGLLIQDCSKCGCPNNFICNKDKKCEYIIMDQEIQKFYNTEKIDKNEAALLEFAVPNFVRIARSPIDPEKIKVDIAKSKILVSTDKVNLEVTKQLNELPRIDIVIEE